MPKASHDTPFLPHPVAGLSASDNRPAFVAVFGLVALGMEYLSALTARTGIWRAEDVSVELAIPGQHRVYEVPAQEGSGYELGAGNKIPIVQQQAVAVHAVGAMPVYALIYGAGLLMGHSYDLSHS